AMVDETIDGFMGDDTVTRLAAQCTGDLLGRPACFEALAYMHPQRLITAELEAGVPVPPTLGQSLGAGGLVAARPDLGWRAVTRQLPAHGARRAAQGARNRTHGLTGFMQSIQFDTLTQCQMLVARFRHRNTPLGKCCTCFVNSGNPGNLPPVFAGCRLAPA